MLKYSKWTLPTGPVTRGGVAAVIMDHPPPRPSRCSVQWFPSLVGPKRSTWLTRDSRQTPTRSKLSLPRYRHVTPISCTSGCKPWYHDRYNGDYVGFEVQHLLPKYHECIEIRMKFSVSEYLITYFLKLTVFTILHGVTSQKVGTPCRL
jgi:hypothetical protein